MGNNLRLCPFCGGEPAMKDNRVYCPYYECQIGGDPEDVPTFSIGAWNARPVEDVLVEACEKAKISFDYGYPDVEGTINQLDAAIAKAKGSQ